MIAALFALQFLLPAYDHTNMTRIMILASYAMGYNLLLGYTGLMSLGHAMFFAAGLYGAGLGAYYLGFDPLSAFLAGLVAGLALSLLVGMVALRTSGVSFMIVTLMFAQACFLLTLYFNEITQGDQTLDIKQGKQTETIFGDQTLTVQSGNRKTTIQKGNDSLEVSMGNLTTDVKMGNISVKVALGKIEMEAMQSIELKVGQSSVKLDQTGVTVKGMMINIQAQTMASFKGLQVTVQGQAMTQVKAPMTMVNGDATLMLKGGITMIN